MNAKNQEDPGEDLASRVGAESPCSDMKRAAAKKLIEKYFFQLTDGCGNSQCDNQNCASSGKVTNLTPNQAAGLAIQLFSQEARLCDENQQPSKVPRTSIATGPTILEKSSLPSKTMNPSCSTDGITLPMQIDASIQFPTPKTSISSSIKLYFPSTSNNDNHHHDEPNDCLNLQQASNNKNSKRQRSTNKSPHRKQNTIKRHCNCFKNFSLTRDSNSDCSIIDDDDDDKSANDSSASIVKSPSFDRLLKAYNKNLTKKRHNKKDKNKKRKYIKRKNNTMKKTNIKKTSKKFKKINDKDGEKDAVAELIVLALYLRYLESKKYS